MCGCRSFMWLMISRSTYLVMCCTQGTMVGSAGPFCFAGHVGSVQAPAGEHMSSHRSLPRPRILLRPATRTFCPCPYTPCTASSSGPSHTAAPALQKGPHLGPTLDEFERHLGAPHRVLAENDKTESALIEVPDLQGAPGKGAGDCITAKAGQCQARVDGAGLSWARSRSFSPGCLLRNCVAYAIAVEKSVHVSACSPGQRSSSFRPKKQTSTQVCATHSCAERTEHRTQNQAHEPDQLASEQQRRHCPPAIEGGACLAVRKQCPRRQGLPPPQVLCTTGCCLSKRCHGMLDDAREPENPPWPRNRALTNAGRGDSAPSLPSCTAGCRQGVPQRQSCCS